MADTIIVITSVLGTLIALVVAIVALIKFVFPDECWNSFRRKVQCCCVEAQTDNETEPGQCEMEVESLSSDSVEAQTDIETEPGQCEMETKPLLSDSEKIEEYLRDRQNQFCHNTKTFTPATLRRCRFDLPELFTELDLLTENGRKQERKTLDEVLANIESKTACKVLIDGEGGIGKSTLLRYIAYRTATENVFDGNIVFSLNARDLEKNDSFVDLIVKQPNMKDFEDATQLSIQELRSFIVHHDGQIVLMIDGLDELRFKENKSVIHLFEKNELSKSLVILTSRTENTDEFINACDVHVRVRGFCKESIKTYIGNHFKHLKNPELGYSLEKELLIIKHPELISMCRNPLLLLTICNMWEDKQNLPSGKSDLFKEIFRSILNQFIVKQNQHRPITQLEDAPVEYAYPMILLGKYMYKNLKTNQLFINKNHFKGEYNNTFEHYKNKTMNDMVDMALKLGFVYEDAPISKTNHAEIYMPPHKLIVESLVGFYLSKVAESEGKMKECADDYLKLLLMPLDESEWRVILKSKHFRMTREFTIGFLGADAGKFLKYLITNDLSTYRSLTTCLKLVENHHDDAVNKTITNHITTTSEEIQKLVEDVSNSLTKFIQYKTSYTFKHINGHFIHILRKWNIMYFEHDILDHSQWATFLNTILSNRRGIVLSHVLCIGAVHFVHMKNCNLSGDVVNSMSTECLRRQVKLILIELDISGNDLSSIDSSSLYFLFKIVAKDGYLNMKNCNLSSAVMNSMIKEFLHKQVKLILIELDISGNDLSDIDSSSLYFLFTTVSQVHDSYLNMKNCNLSGSVMNTMNRKCLHGQVKFCLNTLDVSGNDLSDIDSSTLCFLFTMVSEIYDGRLSMNNCNLSGDVVNTMNTECLLRQDTLCLNILDISNNDFRDIGSSSLLFLFTVISDGLHDDTDGRLSMNNCNLSGAVMNTMITECLNRPDELSVSTLNVSDNDFSDIDCSLLFRFLTVSAPNLRSLQTENCNLPDDVINAIESECSKRKVELNSTD